MMVKRVAGALGAELPAVNLGDGLDAELAGTLRALLNKHEVLFFREHRNFIHFQNYLRSSNRLYS